MVKTWDVIVAGGGPAGLAAAIAARRKGMDVAIFEGLAASTPIDKCCGEGLMPDAIGALRDIGVVLPSSAGAPISGIRFLEGPISAEARFPNQCGAGVRRIVLHTLLAEHAQQEGVAIFRGQPVRCLAPGGVRAGDDLVRARWIVAADGSQSTLRRQAALGPAHKSPQRFGSRQHFQIAPWTNLVEVHWIDGAQAYVTPVSDDEIGVAIVSSDSRLRFQNLLSLFPELRSRLESVRATSSPRGAVTVSRRLPHVTSANIALLGDASGSIDAVTGLGLSLAFQQAVALAAALEAGSLADYSRAHRRIQRLPRILEGLMLAMDRHRWFRRRAIRALASEPAQFARLLDVHSGALPPFASALRVPLALGWKFFTA